MRNHSLVKHDTKVYHKASQARLIGFCISQTDAIAVLRSTVIWSKEARPSDILTQQVFIGVHKLQKWGGWGGAKSWESCAGRGWMNMVTMAVRADGQVRVAVAVEWKLAQAEWWEVGKQTRGTKAKLKMKAWCNYHNSSVVELAWSAG